MKRLIEAIAIVALCLQVSGIRAAACDTCDGEEYSPGSAMWIDGGGGGGADDMRTP